MTLAVGGTRQKLPMIPAVTSQGKARWVIIDGAFHHGRLIGFFAALVTDGRRARKKIFLMPGKPGVHHCKPVKAWLDERKDEIKVFCLPGYSPEPNPDERPNADLQHAIGQQGACAHESQAACHRHWAHEIHRDQPRTREGLLPGSAHQVRSMMTSTFKTPDQ